MLKRIAMPLFTLIAAAALAVGCGDGDESAADAGGADITVTTSSLSKAAFVNRANAICKRQSSGRLDRLAAYEKRNPSADQSGDELYETVTKVVFLPSIEASIDEISELGAPAGDEARVEEILQAHQDAVDAVAELPNISSNPQIEEPFTEAQSLARDYGMDECVNSSRLSG